MSERPGAGGRVIAQARAGRLIAQARAGRLIAQARAGRLIAETIASYRQTSFRDHERGAAMWRGRFRDGRGTLVVDGRAVCEVEIAASGPARRRGLLGRDGLTDRDGRPTAILLTPAASVHTLGMRFPVDVAFLDRSLVVREVVTMPPGRLGRLRLRARHVLETEAGGCAQLGVARGARLQITADRPADADQPADLDRPADADQPADRG